jgi:chromosome segregation ATPase
VTSENTAPIPTNILNPIDTQAAQIRHMIAAAHAEKEHVQSQIKEARRASQRAEAALRLEIETVKKATEKAGSLDLRAKQKALALQEQVKQAWAGSEHAEKETTSVEGGLAELEGRLESIKAEGEGVKEEWKAAKDKEEAGRGGRQD